MTSIAQVVYLSVVILIHGRSESCDEVHTRWENQISEAIFAIEFFIISHLKDPSQLSAVSVDTCRRPADVTKSHRSLMDGLIIKRMKFAAAHVVDGACRQ